MPDWRRAVNRVINSGALDAVYQPILRLTDLAQVGFEALSRFPPADPGDPSTMYPPDRWFSEAGLVGLREELEIVAVTRALDALPYLPDGTYLSVNASAATIIVEPFVLTILGRFSNRIVIELTEHDVVDNYDALRRQLDRLRDHGVRGGIRLAVDDVGSGWSNLLHVRRLEPDIFKIDASLVRGMDKDVGQYEAVRTFATFGRKMGITVVAEGVETEKERACLIDLDVEYGQGFLLARPSPISTGDPPTSTGSKFS